MTNFLKIYQFLTETSSIIDFIICTEICNIGNEIKTTQRDKKYKFAPVSDININLIKDTIFTIFPNSYFVYFVNAEEEFCIISKEKLESKDLAESLSCIVASIDSIEVYHNKNEENYFSCKFLNEINMLLKEDGFLEILKTFDNKIKSLTIDRNYLENEIMNTENEKIEFLKLLTSEQKLIYECNK